MQNPNYTTDVGDWSNEDFPHLSFAGSGTIASKYELVGSKLRISSSDIKTYQPCTSYSSVAPNGYTSAYPRDHKPISTQAGSFNTIYQVKSSSSAYPSNGKSGSYWYVSAGSETSRGNYIDIVSSMDHNAYPNDGIQDGYWYTRK